MQVGRPVSAWESFLSTIPPLNTAIVALVGALILIGWREIRHGHLERHRALMLSATGLFVLFLTLYTVRLIAEGPTSFTEENPGAPGWAAPFYFTFLGIHMVLALVTTVLIPVVLVRAKNKDFKRHKALARKVAPMWLVSIAMGITVYFMLFQIWQ